VTEPLRLPGRILPELAEQEAIVYRRVRGFILGHLARRSFSAFSEGLLGELLALSEHCEGMLLGMEQAVPTTVFPNSASFAGILVALSRPEKKPEAVWNDDALEDDVATLSYEHALQARARYRRPNDGEPTLKKAVDLGPIGIREVFPVEVALAEQTEPQGAGRIESGHRSHEMAGGNLKRASITVRLSATECAQLRQRANDAGLTVSGYLRSCTFEAEALRAQVKEALAELRTGAGNASKVKSAHVKRGWGQWLGRVMHRGRDGQHVAQV
jgi:hypothetical protein